MRIVSAHEGVIPISSSMSNAFIDFSTMDCSILALVSDVVVDGKPLVGYGFNSNGRYSAGEILRRRILPRLMDAPEGALLDEAGNLSPSLAWDTMMRNEKPGGHGERSVAVGVVDMALHDLAAKIAGIPLYRWISDQYGDGDPDESVFVYAAGGYYAPGKSDRDLQDEMRRFLDAGYDVVKMKIGGAPLDRGPAASSRPSWRSSMATAHGSPSTSTAASTSTPRSSTRGRSTPTTCSGTRRSATRWTTGSTRPSPSTTRTRSRPGRTSSRCRTPATSSGTAACDPTATTSRSTPRSATASSSTERIQDMLAQHGWSSRRCIPHGGHQFSLHIAAALKLGGNESYPGEFQPTGGFADDAVVEGSRVALDDRPGIGFEGKANFLKVLRELHE